MKKLLLFLACLSFSICFSQTTLFQTIPAIGGGPSAFRAPNGTSQHTSLRAHYIIPASELTTLPSGIDITTVAFNLNNGTNALASGSFKFYMENTSATTNTKSTTWATAITGMDTVFNGTFTVPNTTAAAQASITLTDTFNYTGGGIFVAYEYIGSSFGTVSAVYNCNTSIAGGLKVIFNATTVPGATLTGSSSYRPILTVGYANPFTNDMIVDDLTLDLGHPNGLNDTSQSVIGIVRNKSSSTLTSVPVTLTITGANPSVSSQTIATLAPGVSDTLTFANLSTATNGIQSVKLSVPADQFTANDSLVLRQSVSCDTLAYYDMSPAYTSIGFNMGSGILAAKHTSTSTINTSVKTIIAGISVSTNNVGNTIKAVVVDTGGVIIDSSAALVITAAHLGNFVSMPLLGNNIITPANPDYFIGIKQYADTVTGYFPLNAHYPTIVPGDRYYSFNLNGGSQSAAYTSLGTLSLAAILETEGISLANSDANDSICPGEMVTFTASGLSSSLYNFKSGSTSVQNTASTTYSTSPSSSISMTVEGTYKLCPVISNASTITVVTLDTSINKTNDSTLVSNTSGASYQWIDCSTGSAVTGATSKTFVPSVSGNYKVVITIDGCSDTSNCYSAIIPVAGIKTTEIKGLSIYPSPTENYLFIEASQSNLTNISLMDVNGKIVFNTNPQQIKVKIDLSGLSSGVYFVNVETKNGKEVKRIIKY